MTRNLYCVILDSLCVILISCFPRSYVCASSCVDITLNAKLLLWNHSDVSRSHLKNIIEDADFVYEESMTYEDSIRDKDAASIFGSDLYPYALLYNRDQTEFVIVSPHYGTCHQCWRCFYIGILSNEVIKKEKHRVINTNVPYFYTESGIHLLMPLDEVIKLKGKPDAVQDSLMTYYYISSDVPVDSEEYFYYKERDMGDQFMTFVVRDGRVVGIAYGYIDV